MNNNTIRKICTCLLVALPLFCSAQLVKHDRILSFENGGVPAFISSKSSRLSRSPLHYKDGNHSQQWAFDAGGELSISKDLHFEKKDPISVDTYLSVFVVWVYNEKPVDVTIEFEFIKDGKKCSSFPFGINFKGWRAAWVSYERDMSGNPEEGMNEIRIKAPSNISGELFFDQLVTAAKADHRHQTPDIQAPFVNKETNSHWLVLFKNSQIKPDLPLESIVSEVQKQDIKILENCFLDIIYTPSNLSRKKLGTIQKEYETYDIKYTDGKVSDLPLSFGRAHEILERIIPDCKDIYDKNGMELRKYFTLMNRVAIAYNNATNEANREILKNIFISMYNHVQDQSVAYGSGLGNATHYGYSFRGIYTVYFLTKDVLRETGRPAEAEKTFLWYAMTNEIFIKPEKYGIDMDAFNTSTTGHISSILMLEGSSVKVRYQKAFSRWIDNDSIPATGLDGAFKSDGAAFHHCNNYPTYAVEGLNGATNMIYLLNRISFAILQTGHQTVKDVLYNMRFYCNETHFPLSMFGHHPDGKGELISLQYGRMAMVGTSNGKELIDKEMGAAYLRLLSSADNIEKPEYIPAINNKTELKIASLLTDRDITPEKDTEGNLTLGYRCISVQRSGNWSAVVHGHSRYRWAAEHYLGANLYGCYLAHGNMQVSTGDGNEVVIPVSSGWVQEGFDWSRITGTTVIHLPVEQLKANILNVDEFSGFEEMLFSDEAFAGDLFQNRTNGSFGMKLRGHDKYNGSHKARKSYHFFDRKIICLGSDIENVNADYNTETTIFQLAVIDDNSMEYWNGYKNNRICWIDLLESGYYIPARKENKLNFEKNFLQYSHRQNTGEETSGNWVSLMADHGKAPEVQSYEYMVLPQVDEKTIEIITKKVPYKVLQKDRNAHIVKDMETNTTSYALFETPSTLPQGLVQKADTSCLIMVKEKKKCNINCL